jgi:hypothetical protein
MSGDTQEPGEKLWEVREISDKWPHHQIGHSRYIHATSRKDAKEQFISAGYKQFEYTRLTAMPEREISWEEGWAGVHAALAEQEASV